MYIHRWIDRNPTTKRERAEGALTIFYYTIRNEITTTTTTNNNN